MKDETSSNPIREFIGIRAKMYSIDCVDHVKKQAKGVSKQVVAQRLTHQTYADTLSIHIVRRDEIIRITSEKHRLFTSHDNKKNKHITF